MSMALVILTGCSPATSSQSPKHHANVTYIRQTDIPGVTLSPIAPKPGAAATDFQGKDIVVADTSRIVSVATSCAEIIAALGLKNFLVGRDLASKTPSLNNIPVVTDVLSVNAEKVLAQKPTVVLVDSQTGPSAALTQIADAGVQIVQVPTAWTLKDVPTRIKAIASILGIPQRATTLLASLTSTSHKPNGVRVAFLYLRGSSAIYLLGGKGSGADALIEAAGAIEVGSQIQKRPFTPMTPEALAQLKPDVFLVMTNGLKSVGGPDGLVDLPGVSQTPAGQDKRIIAVDDGLLLAFGADTFALIDRLAQAFVENRSDS